MKEAFRKHGKWLFIPSPVLILAGFVLPAQPLEWIGIALMLTLLTVVVTQIVLKLDLIN